METIDFAMAIRPLFGLLSECGDTGKIIRSENRCFLALIDVLGHSAEARKVAVLAEEYLDTHHGENLAEVMNGLHRCLSGSRGAVVSLCNFDMATGRLRYTGIGNISMRLIGSAPQRLVSGEGVVGYGFGRPQVSEVGLMPGDALLLHSDGIREHFELWECPGLFEQDAETIVQGILEKFGKKVDDAACMVLKYL